jgi:hypothetical protein
MLICTWSKGTSQLSHYTAAILRRYQLASIDDDRQAKAGVCHTKNVSKITRPSVPYVPVCQLGQFPTQRQDYAERTIAVTSLPYEIRDRSQ